MGQETDADVSYEVPDTKQTAPKRPSILMTLLLGAVVTYAPDPSLIVVLIPLLLFLFPIYFFQILLVWGLQIHLFSDKPTNSRYHLIALFYIVPLYFLPCFFAFCYAPVLYITIISYITEPATLVVVMILLFFVVAKVLLILFSSIILHREITRIVYGALLFTPLFVLRLVFKANLSIWDDFAGIGLLVPAVLFFVLFPPIGLGLRLLLTGLGNTKS